MNDKLTRLSTYSMAHFLVDFCCALLVFRVVPHFADAALLYLVYNYCAFALQMPIGLIADRINRNAVVAALGCGLVGLSFALNAAPLAAVTVAGIGNACFHVGGGIDVMNDSPKKAASLGAYVSPGALGLYFGTQLGKGDFSLLGGAVLMFASLSAILIMAHRTDVLKRSRNAILSLRPLAAFDALLPALCLFLVVVIRSFAGRTMSFAWKSVGSWGLISVCAVVLGKTAGGFVMDLIGARLTALISLTAAAVLFFFSESPAAGVSAIFLFNMTMPVTLSCLARKTPGCKGFSFGLLTFALFIGFVPVGLGLFTTCAPWLLAALCILSALLMLPGADARR